MSEKICHNYVDPPCSDSSSSDDDAESQKAIPVDSKGQCRFAEFHCLKNGAKSKKSGHVPIIVEKLQKKNLVSFCKFVMHFINLLIDSWIFYTPLIMDALIIDIQ